MVDPVIQESSGCAGGSASYLLLYGVGSPVRPGGSWAPEPPCQITDRPLGQVTGAVRSLRPDCPPASAGRRKSSPTSRCPNLVVHFWQTPSQGRRSPGRPPRECCRG